MIFVTVGTGEQQFDRLLGLVDSLSTAEAVVVQHGSSTVRPRGAECIAFVSFSDLLARMREARAIVTHAGVGSIMTSLSVGKKPIVVARQRRFGEAVDDHQVELGARLQESELVSIVEDLDGLTRALDRLETPSPRPGDDSALTAELRRYLSQCRELARTNGTRA